MNNEVRQYLEAFPSHHETFEHWEVQGKLRVRLSLADRLPPASVSSSILAMVFNRERQVLFLHPDDPSGSIAHLLIGGRPEGAETPDETVMREVSEETGWRVRPIRMIGFRHFFHMEPRSHRTDRPYPDFIQPIYAVRTESFDADRIIAADRMPAKFIDYTLVEKVTDAGQRPLLHAGLCAMN